MGCTTSKDVSKAKNQSSSKSVPNSGQKKKQLNPADYIISKQSNAVFIKEEGSIAGEQFNLEECKNCDIFLFDYIATVFIDECHDCRIFVGPVESSVFLRNCGRCDVVIACQQFRSRDCSDCRLALFCATEPIIESCKKMQFACFDFNYFSLRGQLSQAGLKLWNNRWSEVFDFTRDDRHPNWSLFPQEEAAKLLKLEACASFVSREELQGEPVIPVSLGLRPRPTEEAVIVLFLPDAEALMEGFLRKVSVTAEWILCRTRALALQDAQLKVLATTLSEPKLTVNKGRDIIGVELCGKSIWTKVREALQQLHPSAFCKSIHIVPEKETGSLGKAFFETWKDEI